MNKVDTILLIVADLLQLEDFSNEDIINEQNKLYDNFANKYGLINSRGNKLAFSDDSSYFLLCSLEILD